MTQAVCCLVEVILRKSAVQSLETMGTCAGEKAGQESELSRPRLFPTLFEDRNMELLTRVKPNTQCCIPRKLHHTLDSSFLFH